MWTVDDELSRDKFNNNSYLDGLIFHRRKNWPEVVKWINYLQTSQLTHGVDRFSVAFKIYYEQKEFFFVFFSILFLRST